jgi:hypothetical protein
VPFGILPVVFIGAFKGIFIPRILRSPIISTIGGMCYSIYLTHRTTILVLQLLMARFHLHFLIWLAISLILVGPRVNRCRRGLLSVDRATLMDPRWPQKLIARFCSGPRSRPSTDAPLDLDTSGVLAKDGGVGV